MDELLVLIVAAATAVSWWAAKWYYTHRYFVRHTQSLRQAYCKGLNYLLSEKTDKAIDTFADLLASDVETIETHVALGNLFRRRGEVEKAIEIHEELVRRDTLTDEQRVNAQFELGVDYLRSGLYDRAELIFSNLVDRTSHRRPALELLLQIYQQESDWEKALKCVKDLNQTAKSPRGESAAQFLCELAVSALKAEQSEVARLLVSEALDSNPTCFRALHIRAGFLARAGDPALALEVVQEAGRANPLYIPETLDLLVECFNRLGRSGKELKGYLDDLYQRLGQDQVAVTLANLILADEGRDAAMTYLRGVAEANPTLRILNALMNVLPEHEAEIRAEPGVFRLMNDALSGLLLRQPRYRCNQCGFSGQELHWRCPSCRQWDSTVPV